MIKIWVSKYLIIDVTSIVRKSNVKLNKKIFYRFAIFAINNKKLIKICKWTCVCAIQRQM